MGLTKIALGNPVATLVGVLLAILFGLVSLGRLPIQLTPEVEKPEITIRTAWRAAAPEEIEAEIIEPQEKVLRGLPGMTELLAKAQRGQGEITIQFALGYDLGRGLLEVLNRLNRVPRYPDDADEPIINTVGGRSRAIAWFIIRTTTGNEREIDEYQDYVEEVIQTRFERVPGVARSEVFGGREQEMQITFDPYKAASLGVVLPTAAQLVGGNEDVSAGDAYVGKRRYTLRFAGSSNAEQLGSMILEWRDGRPILLRDVADIDVQLAERRSFVLTKGVRSIAVNAHREIGVNVLDIMKGLQEAEAELRNGPLLRAGLEIEQVYDETIYIYRSLEMLRNNLGLGVILAVAILFWFLPKLRGALIIASAIPISLLVAFLILNATGRTLNIISLAGLAFAVGMVLDAAIVVLENIVRLREKGESGAAAALKGTAEVWGALLASTATTVAIFIPVVFMEDEAGQLFADLALTIAIAVTASLFIAITVVPAAASSWLTNLSLRDRHSRWWHTMTDGLMCLTDSPQLRVFWIVGLISVALYLTYSLIPKADYLPEGNRNLVYAFIIPPPGINIDHLEKEMGEVIAERINPYLSGEKQPTIKNYFFVAYSRGVFMGARAEDPTKTQALVPVVNQAIRGFPDTLAFAKRASLFGGFGGGRTIDMNLQGRDIETTTEAALDAFVTIQRALSGVSIRPFPGLELAEPELRIMPNERQIAEAGWNRPIMSRVMRILGDGLYVGDYFDGEERLDIISRVQPWETPEQLSAIPVVTPNAGVLPIKELATITRTAGPNEIRRLDRRRTITLQISPPPEVSLEETLETIRQEIEPELRLLLPTDGEIRYTGTADKLELALRNMSASFLLAIAILYLLMSALFRSFLDSLLVLLVLPLATVGGVIALTIMNQYFFQPMDLLTMIGFIILLGLVVNNAILLVHQTRSAERGGMGRREAVHSAIGLRLRPILMSTLTSIFGMLPLLLNPGAGTELYRGLAGVIVGGMCLSTAFTLILLPSFLRTGEGKRAGD